MAAVPSSKATGPSFVHLDMARGLAALLVVLGHLRGFVFVSYDELTRHSPIDTVVWAVTGFGHQAVMIFFVLSGFFITRSILLDDRIGGFSWPVYLIKRLSRLWIVLIPCLLLTLLWDSLGNSFGGSKFYAGQLYPIYNSGPSLENGGAHLDPSAFLDNLFFLQTIIAPVFGSNGPLWSLANEFWYYLMFPLLYISITRYRRSLLALVSLVLFVAIGVFIGKYMVLSGLIWLAGAFAYIIYDRGWFDSYCRTPLALAATALLLLISLAASKTHYGTDISKDFFIGLAAAAFVLVLARYENAPKAYAETASTLADGSYTMYLVHFPFLAVLVNIVLHNEKFDATIAGYAVFVGLGLGAIIYSYAIYWLFERHTGKLRRYCLKKYQQASRSALRA
jgi:peptidoglycan/LPS O-acetylase OafA/YrhL